MKPGVMSSSVAGLEAPDKERREDDECGDDPLNPALASP